MFCHSIVDIHDAPLRQHQQRALMQLPDAFPVTTANDSPTRIHHVDIAINDFHGARNNFLRQPRVEMTGITFVICAIKKADRSPPDKHQAVITASAGRAMCRHVAHSAPVPVVCCTETSSGLPSRSRPSFSVVPTGKEPTSARSEAKLFRVELCSHDTQLTAFHLTILHHLCGQVFHHVAGDGKTNTNVAAVWGQNRGVNTNQLTVEVHQRATRVTAVNRGIGLDKVFIVLNVQTTASQRRHDARGYGFAQTIGVTDCYGIIANAQIIGVSHFNGGQIFRAFQLNQRYIRAGIFADDFGVVATTIAQFDLNFRRIVDHVVVGYHIAFFCVNDHARTQRSEFLLLRIRACRRTAAAPARALAQRRAHERRTVLTERRIIAKKLLELLRHTRRFDRCTAFHADAHNGRHHLLQHGGKAWQRLAWGR
nr:Uncharacterised protein [Ipomoea batatas]GME07418.1 Uncharacterised protein [Ipomoea batatas]